MTKKYTLLVLLLHLGIFAAKAQTDVTPPEIVCLNGLSVNIMPTGMIQLWATDFLQYTTDDVTPWDQIQLGLRKAGSGSGFPVDDLGAPVQNLVYNCAELGDQTVELWARDAAGNAAYCSTLLIVQDNASNCEPPLLNGTICSVTACEKKQMDEVYLNVKIDSTSFLPPFTLFDLSDGNGCWDIQTIPIPMLLQNTFTPVKDDNYLNGVTSFDIVRLSRHIRGIQPFTEPWQWVAADANRDNKVDLQDSLLFTQLIQGIILEFPNNHSWRFVREDYVFPTPNPLSQPFPEFITLAELLDSVHINFLGIKIGDLNCSAIASVGTEEHLLADHSIRISPNPTNAGAVLTLETEASQSVQVRVLDLTGKLVFETTEFRQSGQQQFDVPAGSLQNSGIYICQVQMDGKTMARKLVRL